MMLIMIIKNGLNTYEEENPPMWGTRSHTHTNVGHVWYGQSHIIHTIHSPQLTLEMLFISFRTVVQIGKYDRPVPL